MVTLPPSLGERRVATNVNGHGTSRVASVSLLPLLATLGITFRAKLAADNPVCPDGQDGRDEKRVLVGVSWGTAATEVGEFAPVQDCGAWTHGSHGQLAEQNVVISTLELWPLVAGPKRFLW